MLIGASIGASDIDYYEPLFPGNDIMRIFPVDVAIRGKVLKVLPPWHDARLEYCRRKGTIPFLSCKVDGSPDGIRHVREQLEAMPGWISRLYITDRHEPEGDLDGGADEYRHNLRRFLEMVDSLAPALRAKIKCGPVLTKTWTESRQPGHGDFDYHAYDPGIGDFLGIDAYVTTLMGHSVVNPSTLPAPEVFLKHIRDYRFDAGDARPRMFPELGVIGMPADHDGSVRAGWLRDLHHEVSGWHAGAPGWTQPWSFIGWIWWNQQGKSTGFVPPVGKRRDFPLDARTVDERTVVKLHPPKPLDAFNAIWAKEHA
jgi:hypothetical protein